MLIANKAHLREFLWQELENSVYTVSDIAIHKTGSCVDIVAYVSEDLVSPHYRSELKDKLDDLIMFPMSISGFKMIGKKA